MRDTGCCYKLINFFHFYFSLHLTTMCLQYKPTVVACFCIHLVCKWSNWAIPLSNEQKEWFSYVDPSVTNELLQQLTDEFLVIYDRCPSRLKGKVMSMCDGGGTPMTHGFGHSSSSPLVSSYLCPGRYGLVLLLVFVGLRPVAQHARQGVPLVRKTSS